VQLIFTHTQSSAEIDTRDGAGNVTKLVDGSGGSWSPTGKSVAFISATGSVDVVGFSTARPLTGQVDRVTAGCPCTSVAWSPDGNFLAFANKNGDLQMVLAGGGTPTTLAAGVGPTAVTWSPNATRVVFGTGGGISSVARAGGAATLMVSVAGVDGVSINPGGNLIAWSNGSQVSAASLTPTLQVGAAQTVASGHMPHYDRTKTSLEFAAASSNGQQEIFSVPVGASAGTAPTQVTTTSHPQLLGFCFPAGGCTPPTPAAFNTQPEG
jgi:hypothetical protein